MLRCITRTIQAGPQGCSLASGTLRKNIHLLRSAPPRDGIRVLKDAVESANLGNDDKLGAIRRLDEQARIIDSSEGRSFDEHMARERAASPLFGGRTVFGPAR